MDLVARNFSDPRDFRDLGRTVVKLGLFATAVGTGGVLGAALAVPLAVEGGALAGSKLFELFGEKLADFGPQIFGSLAANDVSSKLSSMLSRRWAKRDAAFVNHDLSSCMGDAIGECLRELASDEKRIGQAVDRKTLSSLAGRAPRLWARIATYPGTARWSEPELKAAIDQHLDAAQEAGARGATSQPVDAEAWGLVLERMLRNSKGLELSNRAFDAAARQLEARSGYFFFELLKEDAKSGGRRFAAGLFASLGELRRELPEEVATAVVACLEDPRGDFAWRHRAVIRRLRKLDEGLHEKLADITKRLTPELPLDEREPDTLDSISLTKALRAQQRAIPLIGREFEMDELDLWLDDDRSVAIRLVTGLAGTGKTRLAQELCDTARAEEWHAGFLGRTDLDDFLRDLTRNWSWEHPTLFVVDYAAGRTDQLERLIALIDRRSRERTDAPRIRLLLLERHRGLDNSALAVLLDGLGLASHQSRNDWYTRARDLDLEGFKSRPEELRQTLAASLSSEDLDGAEVDRLCRSLPKLRLEESTPLLLQLAIRFRTEIIDNEIHSLSDLLAEWWKEERKLLAGLATEDCSLDSLSAMVVLANLRGGLPDDEVDLGELASAECERWSLGPSPAGATLRVSLVSYLGHAPAEDEPSLAPLEPDLMAEYALLEWFRARGRSPKGEQRLLDWIADHATQRPEQVGAFLIRLCEDLFDDKAWRFLVNTEWWSSIESAALLTAERSLPRRTTELRELSEAIRRALLGTTDDGAEPERARRLNNLSVDLSSLGRLEEALDATQEAVEIRRRLAKSRPDAFEPDLATSLGAMGSILKEADSGAAVACFEEGVRVLLPHVRRSPGAFSETAEALLRELLDSSQKTGIEPDASLIEEVSAILGRGSD